MIDIGNPKIELPIGIAADSILAISPAHEPGLGLKSARLISASRAESSHHIRLGKLKIKNELTRR